MFINILLFIMVALRLWTAIVLFTKARQNKLTNLYWLAGSFVVFGAGAAFAPTAGNPLALVSASLWLLVAFGLLSVFATIQFVSETFYRNRASPAPWMRGVAVVLGALALYGVVLSPSVLQQHPLAALLQVVICVLFGWQGWAGYQAWRGVAHQKTVEDWVKGRYQLVIWYSGCQIVAGLASAVRIVLVGGGATGGLGSLMALVALVANFGVVALSYLAWAAPAGFYGWLNRNYKAVEMREINEEEVTKTMMGI